MDGCWGVAGRGKGRQAGRQAHLYTEGIPIFIGLLWGNSSFYGETNVVGQAYLKKKKEKKISVVIRVQECCFPEAFSRHI